MYEAMEPIAIQILEKLAGKLPYLQVRGKGSICDSCLISGSFESPEQWQNGIFENSTHFKIILHNASGKQQYSEGEEVTMELLTGHHVEKLRKYTGEPLKVIQKLVDWIDKQLVV
jgi:hypothetical protein